MLNTVNNGTEYIVFNREFVSHILVCQKIERPLHREIVNFVDNLHTGKLINVVIVRQIAMN